MVLVSFSIPSNKTWLKFKSLIIGVLNMVREPAYKLRGINFQGFLETAGILDYEAKRISVLGPESFQEGQVLSKKLVETYGALLKEKYGVPIYVDDRDVQMKFVSGHNIEHDAINFENLQLLHKKGTLKRFVLEGKYQPWKDTDSAYKDVKAVGIVIIGESLASEDLFATAFSGLHDSRKSRDCVITVEELHIQLQQRLRQYLDELQQHVPMHA